MADLPQGCVTHEPEYRPEAWEAYSLSELGDWVHLLAKRSQHRATLAKASKDLHAARNYLAMMAAKLDEVNLRVVHGFRTGGVTQARDPATTIRKVLSPGDSEQPWLNTAE
jgi:hypothetical protein